MTVDLLYLVLKTAAVAAAVLDKLEIMEPYLLVVVEEMELYLQSREYLQHMLEAVEVLAITEEVVQAALAVAELADHHQ